MLAAKPRDPGRHVDYVTPGLGITQASVAAFERYDKHPKLSTIRRYAQVVGLMSAHHVEADTGQLEGDQPGVA